MYALLLEAYFEPPCKYNGTYMERQIRRRQNPLEAILVHAAQFMVLIGEWETL